MLEGCRVENLTLLNKTPFRHRFDIWKNPPIYRNRSDHFAIFWHALLKKQLQQKNQDKDDDKDEVKTLNIEEDFINQVGHFQFNTSPYLGSYKHICIVRSTDPLVVILLNLCCDISQVILSQFKWVGHGLDFRKDIRVVEKS